MLGGKNGKGLINLRKPENDDFAALKVRSIKNDISLLERPTITRLVAAFNAKASNDTELLKWYLTSRNRTINFHRKPTENATVKIFDKTHGLRFLYVFHLFFLICAQKKPNTLHNWMCGGMKTSKHNVMKAILRVAYHGCKNLTTRTSKTRQVKCTQMVATTKFTIRVFVTFSDC